MNQKLMDWLLIHYGQETFNPGLDRIRAALGELVPEFQKKTIVTIAGTNGKGETTLWLSSFLRHKKHCVWMSPHIERLTERFRDEAGEIGWDELEKLLFDCHKKIFGKHQLSFYEFLFFVFCTWVQRRNPEIILLEVGLGGRLDAVNVFDANLVLLPSISRDHQEILGHRYDQILREKVAVVRNHAALIDYLGSQYLREKTDLLVGAKKLHLESLQLLPDFAFSARNQLLAHAAWKFLEGEKWENLLRKDFYAHWKPQESHFEHRGEVLRGQNEWHFFGSHNVDGMRKLIQFLHSLNYTFLRSSFDTVLVTFSRRDPREIRTMLRMLKSSGLGRIVVTTFPHPKAMDQEALLTIANQEGLEFAQHPLETIEGHTSQRILVTGSYYFLGHLKSLLRGESSAGVRG